MTTVDQKANPKKSSSALKKLIITLIAMLVLTTGGISTMVQALPNLFTSTLNPIPHSPPMPEKVKKMNGRKVKFEKNAKIVQDGATRYATPIDEKKHKKPNDYSVPLSTTRTINTVRARINEYAAARNYTLDSQGTILSENTGFQIANMPGGITTHSLLMYPQIRDIIPPVADITEAVLITSHYQPGLTIGINVYEITSTWDPRVSITTLPTFGNSIGTATWNMASTTVAGRTINVTATVQSWFAGTTDQWGFKVSETVPNRTFIPQYPPRLYITYMMPTGSFGTAMVSGGTLYKDNVCPEMWIPKRATYINKIGILDNLVQTGVLAATEFRPPFGFDNQSFRWVLHGKPIESSVTTDNTLMDIQGQSIISMDKYVRNIPPVDVDPFPPVPQTYPPPPGPPGSVFVYPPQDLSTTLPTYSGGSLTLSIGSTPPDIYPPPTPPPSQWVCDELHDNGRDNPSAGRTDGPPELLPFPSAATNTYSWNDMPFQRITFNNSDGVIDPVPVGAGWFDTWNNFGSTVRMAPFGNLTQTIGNDLRDEIYNYTSTATEYPPYPIPDPTPPIGPIMNNLPTIMLCYFPVGGVIGASLESNSFSDSLPTPEYTQSENVLAAATLENRADAEVANNSTVFDGQWNPFNGAYEKSSVDFSIPCHGGLNLEFKRHYSSSIGGVNFSTLGPGWSTNLDEKVEYMEEGYLKLSSTKGEDFTFTPNRDEDGVITTWASPPQLDAKVEVQGEGDASYVKITSSDGFVTKEFITGGGLARITTAFGGEIVATRNSSGKITQLTDTYSNRSLTFTYDNDGRITSVTGPDGQRNWTYEYNGDGFLSEIMNPAGGIETIEYLSNTYLLSNQQITSPTAPFTTGGGAFITKVLKGVGEKDWPPETPTPKPPTPPPVFVDDEIEFEILDGRLITKRISFEPPGGGGATIVNDLSYEDTCSMGSSTCNTGGEAVTVETGYNYNSLGQLTDIGDSNGDYVQFEYNDANFEQIARMYNQDGEAVASTLFDSNMRASKIFDILGNYREYTYTSTGKIASVKDREGKITTFTWNEDETMVTKITDPLGRETNYTYDSNKNLTALAVPYKDNNPAATQFEYDSYGYVNKVINPLGKNTTFTYNAYGEMTATTNALNKTTNLFYSKLGKIYKITGPTPDNYEINNSYDTMGILLETKNPRGYITKYEFNSRNLLTKVTNALNQNTYYEYDTSGNLVKVKDHKNNETKLTYDNCGRPSKLTDVDGNYTQTLYNKLGQVSGYQDKNNNKVEITYDKLYRPTEAKTPEGAITKYEYDKEGNTKKVIDPLNRNSRIEYDDAYQVKKVYDNLNNFSMVDYWPSGQVKMTTNPMGQIAQFDYNKLGLLTSTKDNQNNETTIEYNDMGWPTKVTDALSNYTQTEYNMYGLVTKSTNQLGKFTTFEYDANGNCTKQTSPLGRQYTWQYDELDRVKKAITPMGFISEQTYDEVGNVIELKDPLSHLQKFEYNNDYTLKKYIDQINNETAYTYDDADRVTKVTLPEQNYQQYTYDKDSNLKTVTDPLGNVATYNYNLAGELTSRNLPNPNGGTTNFSYAYDSLGRRTSFTDEAGQQTSCTYNPIGLVTQISHPNGKTISSTYDTLNRLTGVTFGGGQSFSFGYDALSRPTTSTDAIGTKTVNYDAASRITSSTSPWGEQTTIAYDDDNRVTSTTIPRGTTSIAYDQDSRPTQITLPGNDTIANTFDAASRLTHSDLPNTVDLDYTYTNHNVVTEKLYTIPDPFLLSTNEPFEVTSPQPQQPPSLFEQIGKMAFRVTGKDGKPPTLSDLLEQSRKHLEYAIANPKQSASSTSSSPSTPSRTLITTIAQFQYAYDGNRNIQARTYPSGYQSFTYDDYDRLTEAVMPNGTYTYTYNSRSNRTTMRFINTALTQDETTTYTYSVDDRMTAYTVFDNILQTTIRTASFTYDSAGNTTQRVITENGIPSTTSFTYYDDNRIHTVTLPSSEVITFTYFADGSRATKESSTEWITYHYATGLVKEVHHLASDHNTTTFTLHYEPGRIIYEPYGGTPTTYYTVTDTQGTVYKLLNSTGTVVAEYTYDPFGNRLTNSAPTIYNPIGFAGTYYDQETNLLYASSRYLDPTTSRFTTKDSYRGDLGSHISQNRYIYCHQNPISYSDPSGFAPIEGDNSNSTPTSTTRTKTEHKENIEPPKPPENKPLDQDIDGTEETPTNPIDTSKLKPGNNFIEIKVGNITIRMNVFLGADGKVTIKYSEARNADGSMANNNWQEFAHGIAAAMEDSAAVMNEVLSDPAKFGREMNNFYNANFTDFRTFLGRDLDATDYRRFGYDATVGYAYASIRLRESPGLKDMLEGKGGLLDQSDDLAEGSGVGNRRKRTTAFGLLMSCGFWASYTRRRVGNFGEGITGVPTYSGSSISTFDLADILFGTWVTGVIFSTAAGKNKDEITDLCNNILTLAGIGLSIGSVSSGGVVGAAGLVIGVIQALISVYQGSSVTNRMLIPCMGITLDMWKATKGNRPGCKWSSLGLQISDFLSLGAGASVYEYCLNEINAQKKMPTLDFFDLYMAVSMYYGGGLSKDGVPMDSQRFAAIVFRSAGQQMKNMYLKIYADMVEMGLDYDEMIDRQYKKTPSVPWKQP